MALGKAFLLHSRSQRQRKLHFAKRLIFLDGFCDIIPFVFLTVIIIFFMIANAIENLHSNVSVLIDRYNPVEKVGVIDFCELGYR